MQIFYLKKLRVGGPGTKKNFCTLPELFLRQLGVPFGTSLTPGINGSDLLRTRRRLRSCQRETYQNFLSSRVQTMKVLPVVNTNEKETRVQMIYPAVTYFSDYIRRHRLLERIDRTVNSYQPLDSIPPNRLR